MRNIFLLAIIFSGTCLSAVIVHAEEGAEASGGLWPYICDPMLQLAALGALCTYIFTPVSAKQEGSETLQLNKLVVDNLFSGGWTSFKSWLVLLLVVLIGGLIALIVGAPSTDRAAVLMGMGWTGLVAAGKGAAQKIH